MLLEVYQWRGSYDVYALGIIAPLDALGSIKNRDSYVHAPNPPDEAPEC